MTRRIIALAAVVLILLSAVSGVVAGAPGDTDTAVRAAQLDIEQPAWVEEPVRTQTTSNGSVYIVKGNQFEISTLNIDAENVVRAGVRENQGQLSYDARDDEYVFSPGGVNGTYTLYWVVEREVSDSTVGNATRNGTAGNATAGSPGGGTVTVTYTAQVRVEHASFAHEPVATDNQEEQKAGYWTEVHRMISGIPGVEDTPEAVISTLRDTAKPWIKFVNSPFAEIGGTFTAIASILIFKPGGWVVAAIIGVPLLLLIGAALHYRQQAREDLPVAEDVERKEQEIWARIRRRQLKNADFVKDIGLSERWASAFRSQIGDNPYQVLEALMKATKPAELRAMGAVAQQQHHDDAEYRVVADSAENPSTADIVDVSEDSVDDGWVAAWNPSDAPLSAYEAMPWGVVESWDALSAGVDLSDVPKVLVSQQSGDVDDLLTRLGIDLRRGFNESPEEFAAALAAFLEGVAAHEHVVDGGEDPLRDLVAGLYAVTEAGAERYSVPYVRYLRDSLAAIAEGLDADVAVRRYVAESRAEGISDPVASVTGDDMPGADADAVIDPGAGDDVNGGGSDE